MAYRVGVIADGYCEGYLKKKFPSLAVVGYPDFDTQMKDSEGGLLRLFAGDTLTWLHELKLRNLGSDYLYKANQPLYQIEWLAAVPEGRQDTLDIIKKGMAQITVQEKQRISQHWIATAKGKDPNTLIIAMDRNYPPYSLLGPDGKPAGMLVEIWNQWSKATGKPISFMPVSWAESIEALRSGEVDIHFGLFENPDRKTWMKFSNPLHLVDTAVYFLAGEPHPATLKDMAGKRVAVMTGSQQESYLKRQFPDLEIVSLPDGESMILALLKGNADALVNEVLSVEADLDRLRLKGVLERSKEVLYSNTVHAGVLKKREDLLETINTGLAAIPVAQLAEIEERWIPNPDNRYYEAPDTLVALSTQEQDWLRTHPEVTVANELDWPPFDFVENGKARGLTIDIVRLAAKKVGLNLRFVNGYSWAALLEQFRNNKIDILPAVYKTPERVREMAFTNNYAANPSVLVTNEKSPNIRSLKDLVGKRLAVVEGFSITRLLLKKHPEIKQFPVKNVLEGLKAVSLNKADAFIGSLGVISYLLSENAIPYVHIVDEVLLEKPEATQLHMATLKDQVILRDILQKGLDAVSPEEKQVIKQRWLPIKFSGKDDAEDLGLSNLEKEWLSGHPKIELGIDPSWPPFEFIDSKGKYSGVASGIVELIKKRLKIEMSPIPDLTWSQVVTKMKAGKIDVLPAVVPTQQRKKYMIFSKPYASFPVIIAAHQDISFVNSLQDLRKHRVGVVKDYFIEDLLKVDHPYLNLVIFKTTADGLSNLEDGRIDAFVGNLVTVGDEIRRLFLKKIKIAAVTEYKMELCLGVQKDLPVLVEILNKTLGSIGNQEKAAIVNAWLTPQEIKIGIDYKKVLIWAIPIAICVVLILLFIIIWNRRMVKEVAQRKIAEERFQTITATSPGAIIQTRGYPDGRIEYLYLSPGAEAFFGIPPEEVIQEKALLSWHPEDQERIQKEVSSAISAEKEQNLAGRIIVHGEVKWIGINASPSRLPEGGIIYNGFILDITERKLAEQEFLRSERKIKAMSQAVEDALIMINGKGEIMFWNQAAETLFGYTSAEAMGMDFHEIAAPAEVREKAHAGIRQFAATGQGPYFGHTIETTAINRTGVSFPVEINLSPFQVDEERFAVGMVRDIT